MEHDQNENDTRTLINDPVQRDDNTHATTNVETLMHLFKGNFKFTKTQFKVNFGPKF